jgi:hypothetical protein
VAPQFWSTIIFNRPEKGAGCFSPPPQIFGPVKTYRQFVMFAAFCGVLRHYAAFCGELATTASVTHKKVCNKSQHRVQNHKPPLPSLPSLLGIVVGTFTGARGRGDCDILEDCGQWLMSIPRDDMSPSNRCRSIEISTSGSRGFRRGGVGGVAQPSSN